ncbi:DUF1203 domain-containing protein [Nocardia sp. XZ_19_385]|uniref:DUF1203 domain-containing protein n=1 Tax=Nocardia sp. XZ_19_385 TaxID=2769488 RepID=UPI0028165B18|nr:DUF1203 domain-containing protein [Nocardia sp. XZ_19_385]
MKRGVVFPPDPARRMRESVVMTEYLIHPITEPGAGTVPMAAQGGEPLRCCLRDAVEGEAIVLFNYEPPLPESPYRERGAVFTHAGKCPGPDSLSSYPPEWLGRPQVLRAYDIRGWIHPATRVHDGTYPEAALAAVLAEPGVVAVHSRNIAYGCFMFRVTVPGDSTGSGAEAGIGASLPG